MTIGEKLFALRKKAGLTAKDAATQVGTSESTLLRIEKGKAQPKSPEMIEAFAKLYGCTSKELTDDSVDINKEATDEKTAPKDKIPASDIPFGQRLGNLRKGKRLTLSQAAEAVGISVGQYKAHEYQNARPRNVAIYDKFAEVLGCDVAYLTEGDERFSSQKPAEKKTVNKKSAPKQERKAPQDSEQITEAEQAVKEPAPVPNITTETLSFGDRLSNLRVDKDIKQQDMADRLGIAISAYRAMEKRDDRPGTMTEYENIAEILGCDVAYLTEGDERFSPQKDVAVEKAPAEKPSKDVDEPISQTLPEKLRSLRKEKKLSQKAAAEAIGVHSHTLLRWEKGEIHPSEDMIQKLSDFYGEDLSGFNAPAEETTEKIAPEKEEKAKESAGEKVAPAEKKSRKAKAADEQVPTEEKVVPTIPSTEPFGKRLSTLRKAKNLTLAQTADKVGITQSAYKSMEYRNYRPRDIKAYDKLAKVLGCDVEYLKEGDKRFEKKAAPTKAVSTEKKEPKTTGTEKAPAEKPASKQKPEKKADVPAEAVSTEKPAPKKANQKDKQNPTEPLPDLGEIEENIPEEPKDSSSSSSEVIRLVSKLSVLLAGDSLSQSEKDAVMASLNGAYWNNRG